MGGRHTAKWAAEDSYAVPSAEPCHHWVCREQRRGEPHGQPVEPQSYNKAELRGEILGWLLLECKQGPGHPKWVTCGRGYDVERPETPRDITESASQHIIVMRL